MSAEIAQRLQHQQEGTTARTAVRARLVLALGPVTMLAGLVWALVQPYRLTLLHPHGQGFWWLVSQPPLYVVLAGLLFRLVVAPSLAKDVGRAAR